MKRGAALLSGGAIKEEGESRYVYHATTSNGGSNKPMRKGRQRRNSTLRKYVSIRILFDGDRETANQVSTIANRWTGRKKRHKVVTTTNKTSPSHLHRNHPASFSLPPFTSSRNAAPVGPVVVVAAGAPSVHAEPPLPLNPPAAVAAVAPLDPPDRKCNCSRASYEAPHRWLCHRPAAVDDAVGVVRVGDVHCVLHDCTTEDSSATNSKPVSAAVVVRSPTRSGMVWWQ